MSSAIFNFQLHSTSPSFSQPHSSCSSTSTPAVPPSPPESPLPLLTQSNSPKLHTVRSISQPNQLVSRSPSIPSVSESQSVVSISSSNHFTLSPSPLARTRRSIDTSPSTAATSEAPSSAPVSSFCLLSPSSRFSPLSGPSQPHRSPVVRGIAMSDLRSTSSSAGSASAAHTPTHATFARGNNYSGPHARCNSHSNSMSFQWTYTSPDTTIPSTPEIHDLTPSSSNQCSSTSNSPRTSDLTLNSFRHHRLASHPELEQRLFYDIADGIEAVNINMDEDEREKENGRISRDPELDSQMEFHYLSELTGALRNPIHALLGMIDSLDNSSLFEAHPEEKETLQSMRTTAGSIRTLLAHDVARTSRPPSTHAFAHLQLNVAPPSMNHSGVQPYKSFSATNSPHPAVRVLSAVNNGPQTLKMQPRSLLMSLTHLSPTAATAPMTSTSAASASALIQSSLAAASMPPVPAPISGAWTSPVAASGNSGNSSNSNTTSQGFSSPAATTTSTTPVASAPPVSRSAERPSEKVEKEAVIRIARTPPLPAAPVAPRSSSNSGAPAHSHGPHAHSHAAKIDVSGLNVLLVDDMSVNRKVLRKMLDAIPNVEMASDGLEAVNIVRTKYENATRIKLPAINVEQMIKENAAANPHLSEASPCATPSASITPTTPFLTTLASPDALYSPSHANNLPVPDVIPKQHSSPFRMFGHYASQSMFDLPPSNELVDRLHSTPSMIMHSPSIGPTWNHASSAIQLPPPLVHSSSLGARLESMGGFDSSLMSPQSPCLMPATPLQTPTVMSPTANSRRHSLPPTHSAPVSVLIPPVSRIGQFDVIITDLCMPQLNGMQEATLVRQLEAEQGLIPIPIIAVTSNTQATDRLACAKAGINYFLAKPFTRRDIMSLLELIALEKAQQQHSLEGLRRAYVQQQDRQQQLLQQQALAAMQAQPEPVIVPTFVSTNDKSTSQFTTPLSQVSLNRSNSLSSNSSSQSTPVSHSLLVTPTSNPLSAYTASHSLDNGFSMLPAAALRGAGRAERQISICPPVEGLPIAMPVDITHAIPTPQLQTVGGSGSSSEESTIQPS